MRQYWRSKTHQHKLNTHLCLIAKRLCETLTRGFGTRANFVRLRLFVAHRPLKRFLVTFRHLIGRVFTRHILQCLVVSTYYDYSRSMFDDYAICNTNKCSFFARWKPRWRLRLSNVLWIMRAYSFQLHPPFTLRD